MSNEDRLTELEYASQRHEEAVTKDAADIAKIKDQIALIVEAMSKLEFLTYRSGHPSHEADLKRLKEIVARLLADGK